MRFNCEIQVFCYPVRLVTSNSESIHVKRTHHDARLQALCSYGLNEGVQMLEKMLAVMASFLTVFFLNLS